MEKGIKAIEMLLDSKKSELKYCIQSLEEGQQSKSLLTEEIAQIEKAIARLKSPEQRKERDSQHTELPPFFEFIESLRRVAEPAEKAIRPD